MATRTAPITKQVALTATETDLGALFGETEGKFRLTVPSGATSSVWLGKTGVTATGGDGGGAYVAGTCVQLPSTSMRGWFAITNGASVTITLECATGGADAPDWSDAGTTSPGGGGGGGGTVDQGTGDPANPWSVQGVNGGTPERLATAALQGVGLPSALTPGGGVKTGLVDAIPAGTNTIGKVDQGAAGATSWKVIDDNSAAIKTAVERIPAQGQALAVASLPVVLASDAALPTGTNSIGNVNADLRVGSVAVTNANPVPTVFQNFPTFNVLALATALGNGKALISIMLSAGGTATKFLLLDVQIMNVQTTNVVGVLADIQLRRITAHSVGADITSLVTKFDTLNTLDAGITVRTGATVTTEASPLRKWLLATDEYAVGGLETESFQASQENQFPGFFFDPRMQPLVARLNEGFQILCNTNTTAGTFDVGLTFSVE